MSFDIKKVKSDLDKAFSNNSEVELLEILKNNSFLFYFLYSRKGGIRPNYCEVSLGGKYFLDFCWLNDNSCGPEWVLVEIEKPKMKLFTGKNEPTRELNHAIEQVTSWKRYFKNNSNEKRKIFGAVSKFRYILVGGSIDDWEKKSALQWRADHNEDSFIEIRSSNIFYKAIDLYEEHEKEFWSFIENPISLKFKELEPSWSNDPYIQYWRSKIN